MARRPPRRALVLLPALLLAGCGSAEVAELPPPATARLAPPPAVAPAGAVERGGRIPALDPATRGGPEVEVEAGARRVTVDGRARTVTLEESAGRPVARADAGVGPTNALSRGPWLWVTDTQGDALLVFRVRPELELVRRVYLPGGPFALALDERKQRLLVTLTARNEVVELPAHGRPSELRRFPTVRQPDAVAVDPATSRIYVQGAEALQSIDPPPFVGQSRGS